MIEEVSVIDELEEGSTKYTETIQCVRSVVDGAKDKDEHSETLIIYLKHMDHKDQQSLRFILVEIRNAIIKVEFINQIFFV